MDTYLVAYGTLLHGDSLGHSIGQSAAREKEPLPIVVFDYKRLFNLRAEHYESSDKLGSAPIERGAANARSCPGARFNGLAIPVTPEELVPLDKRERYYERIEVALHHFEDEKPIGEGFMYVSRPDASWIVNDPERLLPLWRDIVWARTGAYEISELFGRCYDDTTYMADGRTLVVERYADALRDTSDVAHPT